MEDHLQRAFGPQSNATNPNTAGTHAGTTILEGGQQQQQQQGQGSFSSTQRKSGNSTLAQLSSIFGVLQDKASSFSTSSTPSRRIPSNGEKQPEFDAIRWTSLLKRVDPSQPLEIRVAHMKDFAEAISLFKFVFFGLFPPFRALCAHVTIISIFQYRISIIFVWLS
jgi:hypothetical protein